MVRSEACSPQPMEQISRHGCATRTGQTVGLSVSKPQPGDQLPVRVTAAFNRLLALPGTTVREVSFEPARITVTVALRRRRLVCADCQYSSRARYDTRTVDSSWRHLDLGRCRLVITARRAASTVPPTGCAPMASRSPGPSRAPPATLRTRSEEHTSELQSPYE